MGLSQNGVYCCPFCLYSRKEDQTNQTIEPEARSYNHHKENQVQYQQRSKSTQRRSASTFCNCINKPLVSEEFYENVIPLPLHLVLGLGIFVIDTLKKKVQKTVVSTSANTENKVDGPMGDNNDSESFETNSCLTSSAESMESSMLNLSVDSISNEATNCKELLNSLYSKAKKNQGPGFALIGGVVSKLFDEKFYKVQLLSVIETWNKDLADKLRLLLPLLIGCITIY